MSEIDFTAARVLAVAARDAAVRLRDECLRVSENGGSSGEHARRLAVLQDYCDYLIGDCNDAVGAWTRAADLLPPQPAAKCPESGVECGRACPPEWCDRVEMQKSQPELKCPYDASLPQSECTASAAHAGRGAEPPGADAAAAQRKAALDAAVAKLQQAVRSRRGVPVVIAEFSI